MAEELTTKMHAELIGDEISPLELKVWDIHGEICRGTAKEAACKRHNISVQSYDRAIKRLLS